MNGNDDKNWLQKIFGGKEKEQPEPEPQKQPRKYEQDPTMDPWDKFSYYRDKVLTDERFLKQDDEGKKQVISTFFDMYGSEYLEKIGAGDRFDTFKDKWTVDTFNEIKGIAPKKKEPSPSGEDGFVGPPEYDGDTGVPSPKKGKGVTLLDEDRDVALPDHITDHDFEYEQELTPADRTYIAPARDLEKMDQYRERQNALMQIFPDIATKVMENENFQYMKDNPAYFLEQGEESVKELNKWLKDNTELQYAERKQFVNYFTNSANSAQLGELRNNFIKEHPDQDLDTTTQEAAEPFIDGEPGTFLDPKTDKRVQDPESDEGAEYASQKDKSMHNILQEVVKADISGPYMEQKKKLEEEYEKLDEEAKAIEDIQEEAEEWNKKAGDMDREEYLQGYNEINERYNTAYDGYQEKVEDLEKRADEYNQGLQDLPQQIPQNKNLSETLKETTQDAYLEWQYWEKRFKQASEAHRGEEGYIGKPTTKDLRHIKKMTYNAKAKFEAASRMLYNQEGPEDIDEKGAYKWEIFGTSLLKALDYSKTWGGMFYEGKSVEQDIMRAMGNIGAEIDIEWTPEEKEALEVSFGERLASGAGHLIPAIPELFLLGGIASKIRAVVGLKKAVKGFRIIKNTELGKAVRIGLKDPVPTGWQVARTFNPTTYQKVYGSIAAGVINESVFAGIGDFGLGAITGMNTAHLLLPNIKLRGRLQAFNPILDIFYKSGLGATIGMEAGASGAGAVESALTDRPFGDVIDENYPNVEESTKRIASNLIVNSLLFGGMGLLTTGMAKQSTAPIGAKFDKFGQANFFAYFSPVMRNKIRKAAKDFEAKGYPEAATELYTWLDLTKDPISAKQMKKARMEKTEEAMSIMPIGYLRELRQLHGEAIKALEYQGRQPAFDGTITIPIREYGKLKEGQVFEAEGEYYEVIGKEKGKYQALNVEKGGIREFDLATFEKVVPYTLNHPLEIPQRLESHYETVRVLDRLLKKKGRYGAEFTLGKGPAPAEALPEGTGEFYVKPPESEKVIKKRAEIERREQEMEKETGTEPVEMPEYLKKEYSYGDPEKVMTLPAGEFSDNVTARERSVAKTLEEYDNQIAELQKEIDEKFKGRLDLQQRKERKNLQDEARRLQIASDKVENEFESEVAEWVEKARPFLETEIRTIKPEISNQEVENTLTDLWQRMTQPEAGERNKDIQTLLNELIDEEAAERQKPVSEVQPEPEKEKPSKEPAEKEEPPKEKVSTPFGKAMAEKRKEWMGRLNELADDRLFKELKVDNIEGLIDYFRKPAEWEGGKKVKDTGRQVLDQFIKDPSFERVRPLLKLVKEYLQEYKKQFGLDIKDFEEEPPKEKVDQGEIQAQTISFIQGEEPTSPESFKGLKDITKKYYSLEDYPTEKEMVRTEEDFARLRTFYEKMKDYAIENSGEARDGMMAYKDMDPRERKDYADRWLKVAEGMNKELDSLDEWYDTEFETAEMPEGMPAGQFAFPLPERKRKEYRGWSLEKYKEANLRDKNIMRGLMSTEGADERLGYIRERGATNTELKKFIGEELGIGGGTKGEEISVSYKGGSNPQIVILEGTDQEETLRGKKLVDEVRRVFDIAEEVTGAEPVPKETKKVPPTEKPVLSEGEKMRERGERTVLGKTYKRQPPLKKAEEGKAAPVMFSKKEKPEATWSIIEAKDLQPSHLSGSVNPSHFIPEAQPRNRGNLKALADAAREKAANLDPEQLMYSPIAYTGAPIVNDRGEVIQGNGRAEAILYYYATTSGDPQGYKEALNKNLESFGLSVDLDNFKEPVLVRKLSIDDEKAIQLGNYGMKDIEDVSEGSANIKQASNRLTKEQGVSISNILLKGNEVDDTLNDLIRKNAGELIVKLVEANVFSQGEAEKFRRNGEITPEGINAVEGVVKGLFFKGGNVNLPEIFEELPHTVKRGIEKSMPVLLRIPDEVNILPSVRNALMGLYEYSEFMRASGDKGLFRDWVNQSSMFEDPVTERYTPFEMAIIEKLSGVKRQGDVVRMFMEYETLVKGKKADLFEGETEGVPRKEATEEVFGEAYKKTVDDEYEETEVRAEREGEKPDRKPEEGEGGEKETPEPKVKRVDVKDELKQMTDLLDDLDFGGEEMASGATGDIDPRTKMINVAEKLVSKFIQEDIIPFDEIMAEVIPVIDKQKLKQLLPFIKAGYTGYWANAPEKVSDRMDIKRAKEFGIEDLDELIGKMHRPESIGEYDDIIGKRFYIPELSKYVDVDRVEVWQNPEDAKIQGYGGLFGEIPDQFEKLTVGILKRPVDIYGAEKKAVIVDKFRKMVSSGAAIEEPEYDNPEYRTEMMKIIRMYESVGETVMAERLRDELYREPKQSIYGAREDWSWKDYVEGKRRMAERVKHQEDMLSGKLMYEPIKAPERETVDNMLGFVDSMVKRGAPLSPYIKEYVDKDILDKLVGLGFQHNKLMADLGYTPYEMADAYYLNKRFWPSAPWAALYPVGAKARAYEEGREGATKEKVNNAIKNLNEAIAKTEREHIRVRERSFGWNLKNRLWKGKKIDNFSQLAAIAKDWGLTNKTAIREEAEVAFVEMSKAIARDGRLSAGQKFSQLLALHKRLPTLSYRTGEIKEKQQYSTPPPISFLMGRYTNAAEVGRVLDPSAGNGSLLITANRSAVRANEIDDRRFWNLVEQGYRTHQHDSFHGVKEIIDGMVDALHVNPPFGGAKEDYNGFPLHGEYIPVAYALESLKDEGKAAIIVGGHIEFKDNGQMKGKDLIFFNWLNKYFNVEDIIQIPGEFYEKMGARYPIKLILVNGRKVAPEGAAPLYSEKFEPVETWTDLEERVSSLITNPHEKSVLQTRVDAKRGDDTIVDRGETPTPPDPDAGRPDAPVTGETGDVDRPGGAGGRREPVGGEPRPDPGTGRRADSRDDYEPPVIPKPEGGSVPKAGGRAPRFGEIRPERDPGDLPVRNIGKPDQRTKQQLRLTERTGNEVTTYLPMSNLGGHDFVVPASIALELEDALTQLAEEVGDIDQYVVDKLNYNSIDDLKATGMYGAQSDGIAQAVYNIENKNSMIIGHQTGVGKGQIAAGLIRYAITNGKMPVFITKSADLFTDMYRDLVNIGFPEIKPFIMNRSFPSGGKTKVFHPETEEVVAEFEPKTFDKVVGTPKKPGNLELPEDYDLIFTSYSQFTTTKEDRDTQKREFLDKIASEKDVVFIMDESHTASGQSNVGQFFMDWVRMTEGGLFLSATYAKRPDNMPLYSLKSVLSETNMDYEDLIEAIRSQGAALQEIITLQLTEAGQFSRVGFKMDADFNYLILGDDDPSQPTYNPELGAEMVRKYDEAVGILRDIIRFQEGYINPVLEAKNESVKKEGQAIEGRKGTSQAGISNTPYFSRVWNIIDQLLLSMKMKETVPLVVKSLEQGRKPAIFLKTTQEAMFDNMVRNGELERGQTIPLDFSHVFKRGMDTIMKYTEKDTAGVGEKKDLTTSDLSETGRRKYYELLEKINNLSTGIPISPIDVLRKGIQDAGFEPIEVSGRSTMFDMNEQMTEGKYLNSDKANKITAIKRFNNNPGTAIIATRSGTTGVGFHSSIKFKDQSERDGFFPDTFLDINEQVQAFGRLYRADQVNKPSYYMLTSQLPAEKRMFMMTARKLKSLDANTSGNQKQSKNMVDVPDFFNKYGDQVVYEYLEENPGLNSLIGNPLDIKQGEEEQQKKPDAAHKVTGKIQVLSSEMQDEFYRDVTERYESLMDYLNSTGQNDLMVTSEDLGAKMKNTEVAIQGQGGFSSFGDDTILNTADVNVTRRPYTKAQLQAELDKIPDTHVDDIRAQMNEGMQERAAQQIKDVRETYDEKRKATKSQIMEKEKLSAEEKEREYEIQKQTLDEHEEYRIGGIERSIEETRAKFNMYLNYFTPGRVLEVPFTEDEQLDLVRMNKGVFISFDINMNKKNPWVPSNFQLKFATADSRKVFRIPASKNKHIKAIIDNSYNISQRESQEALENWDQIKKTRTREIRFIVTGNILQGMNLYKGGRLIQFTKDDGTVDKGILMPENWVKPDINVSRIPINKAAKIVKALAPRDFVESYNGDVLIKKMDNSSPQIYELRVPDSSQRGKKYWANERIKDLLLVPFEKRGDRMVGVFREGQLQDLLDILSDQFKTVLEVDNHQVQKGQDSTESYQTMEQYGAGPRKTIDRGGLSNPYKTSISEMSHPKGKRIAPDPVSGAKPKKYWEIQLDLTKATGIKIDYQRRPSTRSAAIGVSDPSTGRVIIKWEGDMDTLSHEIGHKFDDIFGLLGPEAHPVWTELMGELENLWEFGSKPPRGHDNPEQYKMMEGMAEFIRALIVNPAETKRRFPFTYDWVKGRVSQSLETWQALNRFSKDIREYWGSDYYEQLGAHLHLDPNTTPSPWTWNRENEHGQFRITPFDRFNRLITNMFAPVEVSWRWAMRQKGIDVDDPSKLPPSQNFEILLRLHMGLDVKLINELERGFTTFNNERIIDEVTGKPRSFKLLFEQLPRYTYKDMDANLAKALKFGLAERIVEMPEIFQARQIFKDLHAEASRRPQGNKLPPLDILYKPRHAHIVDKFSDYVNGILTNLEEGELKPEDVFLDPDRYDFRDAVIIGHNHPEFTDYEVAVKAVEEYEKLKHTNPDEYKWMSEFMRVYRAIGEDILDLLHDGDMISTDALNWIKSTGLYYVAMQRLFALDPKDLVEGKEPANFAASEGYSTGGKDLEPKIVIHRFEGGSHKALRNPVETLTEMWFRAKESVELNIVVGAYAKAFSPKYMPRMKYEGPPPKTGQVAFISKTPVPQSITYFLNGKKRFLAIRIPEVYEVFKDMLPESRGSGNIAMKMLAFFPQILRRLIVGSPPFMIRNITRDSQHLLMMGKGKRHINLLDILPNDRVDDLFERYGAGQFGHLHASKRAYYRVMKGAMFDASRDPKKWLYNPATAARRIGDKAFGWMLKSERPVRRVQFQAAYREGIKKYGLNELDALLYAAYHAGDLMHFMVLGTITKELNKIFIFTGAAVRGLDKIVRTYKRDPWGTSLAILLMSVIPSVLNSLLMAMFASDEQKEEYLHQPHYLRDTFYRIPLGDGWLIIPKAFELGVFGSIFQRAADKMFLGDEYAFDQQFLQSILHLVSPYDMAGIMGGYSGFIAAVFNKDMFRQKFIVPPDQESASIASRNTTYASKFGKMLQEASDFFTKKDKHYVIDARKVDAFIRGQMAYYGNYFLNTYESLAPGEKQKSFTFDLTDTGLWRAAPVYSSPHVQYMLGQFEEHPWLKEYKVYEKFNVLLQKYFTDEVQKNPEEKQRIGSTIRQLSEELRPEFEKANLYKVDEAVKMLRLEKYK